MNKVKTIIKRAIKNGIDLSFVENYNEKKIFQGLYDFFVINKYFCSMDDKTIYVGPDIVEDVAEITIKNKILHIKPLTETGLFETIVALFKYVEHLSEIKKEYSEDDVSTEQDEDSSEELWL